MRKHFSIGVLSALAAALCVAQSARADIVTFNDIPIVGSHGMVPNDFYWGGLHFNDQGFAVMPLNLDAIPSGQTSTFLEAGANPAFSPQDLVITHYTGQAHGNFDPVTPAVNYADGAAFNLWYLKLGLGGGTTPGTDMVTIIGDNGSCVADACPHMTVPLTQHFKLIDLTQYGFTDLTSVTITEQTLGDSGVLDQGWLGIDDISYTAFDPGPNGDNSPGERPSPVPAGNVPEPSAWALMIVGFGGVGAILRRNRRVGLAAA